MSLPQEKQRPALLIAEDDARLSKTLALEFQEREYEVSTLGSSSGLDALNLKELDFAVVDLRLGSDSGLDLIATLKARFPEVRVVLLTGYGSIPTAVEAIKRGAVQYLTKPASVEDIEKALWGEEDKPLNLADDRATTLAENERDFIESVLLQCDGNITLAAKRLGLHRQSLQRKLRKFR